MALKHGKNISIVLSFLVGLAAVLLGMYLLSHVAVKKEEIAIGDEFVLYGMLHNHSYFSDGLSAPEDLYHYAKKVLKLDFYGLADHGFMLNDREWKRLQEITHADRQSDDFFMFHGFEWSSDRYGDISIFFSENRTDYRNPDTDTFTEILQWIEAENAIGFLNHPGRDTGVEHEFEHFRPEYSPSIVGIELWNKGRKIPAYYYYPGFYENDGFGVYDEALQRGWHIGAAGSTDNHLVAWLQRNKRGSRLGVLVKKKSKNAIENALRKKRFFTTDDRNISMSLKIHGQQMGSTIEPGTYTVNLAVHDADHEQFSSIELIKNGAVLEKWENTTSLETVLDVRTEAQDYFYLRVLQADNDMAISSPVFVE